MIFNKLKLSRTTALAPLYIAASGLMNQAEAKNSKPNFVVILIDDMGYGDIGPFGATTQKTPNLDKMAAEGMKLTSFYACPISSPSRMALMTGSYPIRAGMPEGVFMPADKNGINPNEITVAELLKAQGYKTACIGKWHLGDAPEFMPNRHGFDYYFGLPYSNDMSPREEGGKSQYEATSDPRQNEPMPPLPLLRNDKVLKQVKTEDQEALIEDYTKESVQFIHENKNRPFFLYLSHNAVHVPFHPSKKFSGRTGNGELADWDEEMDWSVGEVLNALLKEGLDKNTMVIFTSDNGSPFPMQGRSQKGGSNLPFRGVKHTVYEGGLRVPTIAWWPGKIKAGTSCDDITSNMDILPTLVSLAGGKLPTDRKIDGVNLWPQLSGVPNAKAPRTYFDYYLNDDLAAIREGEWKLIRKEEDGHFLKTPELYNLVTDQAEKNNVATQHPDIVERLEKLAQSEAADLGDGKPGPGCRKTGHVDNPKTILPSDYKPYRKLIAPAGTPANDLRWLANESRMLTAQVQKAIDFCEKKGGGTVLFGAGRYTIGQITLKDNVTLQLDTATVLFGSPYPNDYKYVDGKFSGLICAKNAKNFSIKGGGTIDGNSNAFNNLLPGVDIDGKPFALLQFSNCTCFVLENLKLTAINCLPMDFIGCSESQVKEVKINK